METLAWIGLSLLFNAWFAFQYGARAGTEFLTAYLVEKSLSIDNLFVILMIFNQLKIPTIYRHRVLFYGILGAIVMRGGLILIGAELLHRFHWVFYIFGAFLLFTAMKLLSVDHSLGQLEESFWARIVKRFYPVTETIDSKKFFVVKDSRKMVTPLFLALVLIETMDFIFAFDSIPAVLAVTRNPLIAFSSNIFAVLGMRSLYFLVSEWVTQLRYLKPGLAFILGFIGIKMLISEFFEIPTWLSLAVIFAIILGVVLLEKIKVSNSRLKS